MQLHLIKKTWWEIITHKKRMARASYKIQTYIYTTKNDWNKLLQASQIYAICNSITWNIAFALLKTTHFLER